MTANALKYYLCLPHESCSDQVLEFISLFVYFFPFQKSDWNEIQNICNNVWIFVLLTSPVSISSHTRSQHDLICLKSFFFENPQAHREWSLLYKMSIWKFYSIKKIAIESVLKIFKSMSVAYFKDHCEMSHKLREREREYK